MIDLRRSIHRHHDHRRRQEMWRTFYPLARGSSRVDGFGTLELFNEVRLPPGADVPRRAVHGAEVVTYVREGALRRVGDDGQVAVVEAGEVHRFSGGDTRHTETNASRTHWTHLFQIWLRPPAQGAEAPPEQKRFSASQRKGLLCVVASPDGRLESLRLCQDAFVYSALLAPGEHVAYEMAPCRSAWLHVVEGEASLGVLRLVTGDGAGFVGEHAVSLTAVRPTEILLLDLGEPLPIPPERRGVA